MFLPDCDAWLLFHHLLKEHLRDVRLKLGAVMACMELVGIGAIGVAIVFQGAAEKISRETTDRVHIAHVAGGQPAADDAADMTVDVNQRHGMSMACHGDGSH